MAEKIITDEIGKYFKQERALRKYPLRYVQKLSGISNSFLSEIENGKRMPGLQTFVKLCLIYNTPQRDIEKMLLILKIKLYSKIKNYG